MQLTDDDIREFSQLWEEEFGERLSSADAQKRASEFMTLFITLARPPHDALDGDALFP